MNTDRNGNKTFYFEVLKVTEHDADNWRVLYRDEPAGMWRDMIVTEPDAVEAVGYVASVVWSASIRKPANGFDGTTR